MTTQYTEATRHPGTPAAALPETNAAATEVLSLPVHPSLSDADPDRIAAAIRSFELGDA